MNSFFHIIKTTLIFIILTLLTQVGGAIYLLYKPVGRRIKKKYRSIKSIGIRIASFSALYLLLTFTLIPLTARQFDRVPMPITEKNNIKPGTFITWLANRHYVDPELKNLIIETSTQLPNNITLIYLDANFPLIDGFPLLPHLSHNDGEKIDIAFIYSDDNGVKLNDIKSLFGYGVVEGPAHQEFDQPSICMEKGYWQYSFLTKLANQNNDKEYKFDIEANSELMEKLASNNKTGKIFIEPHLKTRMNLTDAKIRFHGCQAVRHDDHIHVQL